MSIDRKRIEAVAARKVSPGAVPRLAELPVYQYRKADA